MDQAALQLVIDLASDRVCTNDSSFKLSDEQLALGVSRQLVYLAGICLAGQEKESSWSSSSPSPSIQAVITGQTHARFVALQEYYWNLVSATTNETSSSKGPSPKLYHLSPRLCTNEQKKAVEADLATKVTELECLAREAARELIDATSVDQYNQVQFAPVEKRKGQPRNKCPHFQRKKRQSRQKTRTVEDRSVSDDGDDLEVSEEATSDEIRYHRSSAETLVDMLGAPLQHKTGSPHGCEAIDDETSWIQVKRRLSDSKTGAPHRNIEIANERLEGSPTPPIPTAKSDTRQESSASNRDRQNAPESQPQETATLHPAMVVGQELSTPEKETLNIRDEGVFLIEGSKQMSTTSFAESDPNTAFDVCHSLRHPEQARIRELEDLLEKATQRLADERLSHARILQKEKERHEDLIQALQLRLYIGETRLKTYEDALEDHIQAVARNVSNHHRHNSTLLVPDAGWQTEATAGRPSSPSLASSATQNAVPSPSLIAKVLQRQRTLPVDGDATVPVDGRLR